MPSFDHNQQAAPFGAVCSHIRLLVQLGGDFFQIIGVKLLDLTAVHGGGNGGVDGQAGQNGPLRSVKDM